LELTSVAITQKTTPSLPLCYLCYLCGPGKAEEEAFMNGIHRHSSQNYLIIGNLLELHQSKRTVLIGSEHHSAQASVYALLCLSSQPTL